VYSNPRRMSLYAGLAHFPFGFFGSFFMLFTRGNAISDRVSVKRAPEQAAAQVSHIRDSQPCCHW
jgi:hypothetical protein